MLHDQHKVFYDIEEVTSEGQTLQDLLYNSKRSLALKWIYSNFLHYKIFNKVHSPNNYFTQYINNDNREKLINYITPLIAGGELKMKIRKIIFRSPTVEELAEHRRTGLSRISSQGVYSTNHLEYLSVNAKNVAEGMQVLQSMWFSIDLSIANWDTIIGKENQNSVSDEIVLAWQQLDNFEEWAVFFTLPENNWEM